MRCGASLPNPLTEAIVTGHARYTMDIAMRGPAAPQGAALAARPCAHHGRSTRARRSPCRAWSRSSPGRTCRAGSTPPPARRLPRRSRRHLHARQRRALRRPAPGRRGRRDRGRRRGRLPRCRSRLRDPARRVRSRGGDGARRPAAARQGRCSTQNGNMFCTLQGEIGDVAKGFDEADAVHEQTYSTSRGPARPPRDARLDRLARARTAAGTSAPAARARSPSRRSSPTSSACRRARSMSSPSGSAAASAASRRWCPRTCALFATHEARGRPVKWEWTREEEFIGATTRHPMTTRSRSAPGRTAR